MRKQYRQAQVRVYRKIFEKISGTVCSERHWALIELKEMSSVVKNIF